MNQTKTLDKKTRISLIILLVTGLILRLFHLDYQSLWVDELYTIQAVAPEASYKWLLNYLITVDQHPPLYFLAMKVWMSIVGYTEFTLRLPAAILGTYSIYAIFLLGREMHNTRTGMIAALLTTVNIFNISYSQEGRSYIFIFTFAVLSVLYLLRIFKNPNIKNTALFTLFSIILIYTHYFSLFFLFSQIIIGVIFMAQANKQTRIKYFKYLSASLIIIGISYIPWLPALSNVGAIKSFWISPPSESFMVDYFYSYFGYSEFLKPFLLVFLLIYTYRVFSLIYNKSELLIMQPISASFIILLVWVLGTVAVPYIRSLITIPMLYPRYTAMNVPAYILALSLGIDYIKNNAAKTLVVVLFVTLSLFDVIVLKKYYTEISKGQFRELTQYLVAKNTGNYPMVEYPYSWQHEYYFKRYNVKPDFIALTKEKAVDSIIQLVNTPKEVEALWLVDTHLFEALKPEARTKIESAYISAASKSFSGAHTELFYRYNTADTNVRFLNYNDFPEGDRYGGDQTIAIWSSTPTQNKTLHLPQGLYELAISARGTEADKAFPGVKVMVNSYPAMNFNTNNDFDIYTTKVNLDTEQDVTFHISLTNDHIDANGNDRNVFIKFIRIKKLKTQ